jgi:hypothetical protein
MSFRRALLALVSFAMAMVHGPAIGFSAQSYLALEELRPEFFWDLPDGGEITAIAAYADGGVAAGATHFDDRRTLYRIDAAGRTLWSLELGKAVGDIIALARDPRDGLYVCTRQGGVTHVTAEGEIGWRNGREGASEAWITGLGSCDQLLTLADGSALMGGLLDIDPQARWYWTLRFARIGPDGAVAWIAEKRVLPSSDGVDGMIVLPDRDILIWTRVWPPRDRKDLPSRDKTNAAGPPPLPRPLFWQARLSPNGTWRPATTMERRMPLPTDWDSRLLISSSRDRLMRTDYRHRGDTGEIVGCRFPVEEWSPDGGRLLDNHELVGPARGRNTMPSTFRRTRYLSRQGALDFYLIECDKADSYLVAVAEDWSSTWYPLWRVDSEAIAATSKRVFVVEGFPRLKFIDLPDDIPPGASR